MQKRKTMKHIILFFACLLPCIVHADEKPTKGANAIIITNNLNAGENFKIAIEKILDLGLLVDRKDNEFYTVTTKPRNMDNCSTRVFFSIRCKDGKVIITGFHQFMETRADEWDPIVNRGMKGSIFNKTWIALCNFSSLFSGDREYIVLN